MTNRKIGIVHWVGQLISYVCIFEIKKLHDIFSRNTELIVNSMILNMLSFTIKRNGRRRKRIQSKQMYLWSSYDVILVKTHSSTNNRQSTTFEFKCMIHEFVELIKTDNNKKHLLKWSYQ